MDILNTQAIDANVIDPLLNRIKAEIIPQLQTAIREEINNAIVQISNVLNGTLIAIQGIEGKAIVDVEQIIAGLDGWTLSIPVIQLNKPKDKS